MPGKTLLLLGSGPGIGISIASNFSVRGFTHIALVSRNTERLKQDQDTVLDAIQERGYSCQVKTWTCDLSDFEQLERVLGEVEGWGSLEVVVFNAARVAGKGPLEEGLEELERDFRLTNLALYKVAQWAIPILQAVKDEDRHPSFFVTSTTKLYKEPVPDLVSLSMVKSAQRALVLSLHAKFGEDVHVALLSVGGVVDPKKKVLSPENIAERCWQLYRQRRGEWKREEEIDDEVEGQ
ncbi:hypothetical protein M409DRAFT_71455 [Zasmidium cellare ATCC 36951]|uniref:Ketoreductase (KR) domain-containing protein n=1 Tax=Zasmidium cellare ATCC 36951 TaxID=1080233 RepID=A0A6A6BVN0_ZASCE|nr:uncharacterized protein M409DRAFT_71455 [Zasmidium cellare ATCC 36951]KAF2158831.1 hypothetical protein M409DRAFT_71455 [Zasmidium cellare ATCC 36951]